MNLSEYTSYDAVGLAELVKRGDVSADEVSNAAFQALKRTNSAINAVVEIWTDESDLHPSELCSRANLVGVPFLIKDLAITRKGRSNELGSRIARGMTATSDSTLMSRFRQAGLRTIGRTTTPEFAISTTTESTATGPTRNPWDTNFSAGGSSGGSAAAVAAGIVPLAHATDGGGSIRIPASANGLFGLKPTRGRVSNGPTVDEVWSGLAVQLGVSRSVRDSAALLDAVQGGGVGEPYYIESPKQSYLAEAERDPDRLKVGFMINPMNGSRSTTEVAAALSETARLCEALGHHVSEVQFDAGVSWDEYVFANAQFWCLNTAGWIEAIAAATSRKPSEQLLEPATWSVYNYGRNISGLDILHALDVRNRVTRSVGAYFKAFDILLTPTLPNLPPQIGEYNKGQETLDGLGWVEKVFSQSPFTALANVAGIPAMSVPLHQGDKTDLPIGSQFLAGFGQEAVLFNLAGQLERACPWADRRPVVWAGD